jgi:hypothetical protein
MLSAPLLTLLAFAVAVNAAGSLVDDKCTSTTNRYTVLHSPINAQIEPCITKIRVPLRLHQHELVHIIPRQLLQRLVILSAATATVWVTFTIIGGKSRYHVYSASSPPETCIGGEETVLDSSFARVTVMGVLVWPMAIRLRSTRHFLRA